MKIRVYRVRAASMLLVVLLFLSACAKTVRPGAVDVADSRAFDILGTAAVSIEELKKTCPSGPTSPCPQAQKDAINKIIDAYNVARKVWLDYRETVRLGKPASAEELAALLSKVVIASDEYRKLIR